LNRIQPVFIGVHRRSSAARTDVPPDSTCPLNSWTLDWIGRPS